MDKKRIIVLINDYIPVKGADGHCFQNLLKVLNKEYEIHIVTAGDEKKVVENNGIFTYGVSSGAYIDQNILKQISDNCKDGILKVVLKLTIRCFFKFVKFFFWPDVSIFRRFQIEKKCDLLLDSGKYCAIITISGSYTNQIVGLSIKKKRKDIKWISLLYDPVPIDNFIYKYGTTIYRKKKLSWDVLQKADICITTKPLIDHYKVIRKHDGVIWECGLPLVKKINKDDSKPINYDNKKINLIYIGSLNFKIRNPEYWFKLVAASVYKDSICIHIVGGSNCMKLAEKYRINEQCIFHGPVDKNELAKFYNLDSILINLGNYVSYQLPSKVLEYISTGLPIISIEPNTINSTNEILAKYKNTLVIDQNNCFNDNVHRFDSFINKPIDRISFDVIESCFKKHTPNWNAMRLSSLIEGVYDNNEKEEY